MGKIILTKAEKIKPSQDFVKEKTVDYILECIVKKELNKLPPTPIVRNDPDGSGYIAIDGHNLIVIYDLLDQEFEVYLADSADDKLIGLAESSPDAIAQRNHDLKEKYDLVIEVVNDLKAKRITSFKELRMRYDYLSDFESAKKHYDLK